MTGIYKITDETNGKVYIGQSVRIAQRWLQHKQAAESSNTLLYRAMRAHGIDNFKFEIIEECVPEKLNEREVYWIAYYDSFNKEKGYNMTPGGTEPIKVNPQELYDLWDAGYCMSDILEKMDGKIGHTTIQNYLKEYENYSAQESNRRGGQKSYAKAKESGNLPEHSFDRMIKQYDLWGNYVATWSSQNEIERALGIDSDVIGRVLNGRQIQAGGYQWLEEGQSPVDLTKQKGFRFKFGVIQYTLEGQEVQRFLSIKDAAAAMNCDGRNIARVCKHELGRATSCGYKWEYDFSIWDRKKVMN